MNTAHENQLESWTEEMDQKKRKFGNIFASIRKNKNEPFEIQILRGEPFLGRGTEHFDICDMNDIQQAAAWVEATYRDFYSSNEVELEHDYF